MIVTYLKSLMRRRSRVRLRKWLVPFVVIFFVIVWITRLNSFSIGDDDDADAMWSYNKKAVMASLQGGDDTDRGGGVQRNSVLQWLSVGEAVVGGKQLLAHVEKRVAQIRAFLPVLYPADWGKALDADEVVLLTQRLLHDLGYFSKLSCKELDAAHIYTSLSTSDRKYVDVGLVKKREVVLKTQGRDLNTKVSCMQSVYDAVKCTYMGNYRLLREILFYITLENPLIVQQLGFCLRGDRISGSLRHKGVILAVEQGHSLVLNDIKHYSWLLRLQVIYQISSIINYLSHTPLGSLRILKLKSEDFVVIGDQIKLSDLDDLVVGEHPCNHLSHCYQYLNHKNVAGIQCLKKICVGLNEKLNLKMVSDHMLLPLMVNVPSQSKKPIGLIIGQLQNLEITTEYLVDVFSSMLAKAGPLKFSLRWYLKGHGSVYRPKHRYRYYDNNNNNDDDDNNNQGGDNYVGGGKHRKIDDNLNDDDDSEDQTKGYTDLNQQQQEFPHIQRPVQPQGASDDEGDGGSQYHPHHHAQQGFNLQPSNVGGEEIVEWKDNDVRYFRYNASNIPGQFDYTCVYSRASWGCVKTAYNISQAKQMCTRDPICKAFVILSGNPDTDPLLTVIFKNSSKSTIHQNIGSTLFIKVSSLLGSRRKSDHQSLTATTAIVRGLNLADCVSRSQSVHQVARGIREKRLRHHIGLRGVTEDQWLTIMRQSSIDRAYEVSSSGQFLLNLHWTDPAQGVPPQNGLYRGSVVFKGQQNSKTSYVGGMIVYNLDRLLGLYHTPPVAKMVLSAASLQGISKNKKHLQQLQELADIDGSVEGFVQPPQPSSLTVQSITLQPLDQLADHLTNISKSDKLFLEYILLVWLTKIKLSNDNNIGVKGHVIMFNGDQAFTEFKAAWLKYFNHCRFPNIVYKTLTCFRCNPPANKSPSIPVCGLGEQVFTNLQRDGVYVVDIYRKGREQIMNYAAADLLNVVDLCIQKHGRKNVLY